MDKFHILRKRVKTGEYLVNLSCSYSDANSARRMIDEMKADDDELNLKYEYLVVKVM